MFFTKLFQFLRYDIWRIPLKQTTALRSFFIKVLRMVLTAIRRFVDDKCALRASALTYYSLFSIVPVLAAAFGIAKGFGFEETLRESLLKRFAEQQEVLTLAMDFAHSMLEHAKGGLIAGVGVFILLWTVIRLLGSIEESMNDIWRVSRARTLIRKFSDYLAIIIVCPILFTTASSLTIFLSRTEIQTISPLLIHLTPHLLAWLLFTILYLVMPNTRVRIGSAILGGVLAGTAFQMVQWAWINIQIALAGYGAIYGSFAALPLFLLWLQISWTIVLIGAAISYASQHVTAVEFQKDISQITPAFKRLICLLVTHKCVTHFEKGLPPLNKDQLSLELEIPISLTDQVINDLLQTEILAEVSSPDYNGPSFQPCRDIGQLTIKEVIDALEHQGSDQIPVAHTKTWKTLSKILHNFDQIIQQSPDNQLVKDL